MATDTKTERRSVTSRRGYPVRRAMAWLLIVAAIVAGVLVGSLWWQERPLVEAEEVLESGDARGAIVLVSRYLRQYPEHGRALALKARALVAIGESAAAIELFERAGAEDARDFHAWAEALLQQQQWSAAAPLLEHVYEAGIDRADVLHELAACRAKLGDYAGAVSAAEELARIPEFEARGQMLLGTIHRDKGNLKSAIAAWERVLVLHPEAEDLQVPASEFLSEFGRIKLSTGDSMGAAEVLEMSQRLTPAPDTLSTLGEAYAQSGRVEQAASTWREVVDVDPANPVALVGLADLALAQGDVHAALDWLRPLESGRQINSQTAFLLQRTYTLLDDRTSAQKWKSRADEMRRIERVQEVADQLMRDAPESSWAQVVRAYRFAEAGNWSEAERILKPMFPAAKNQPFIVALLHSVETRGTLPALEGLPVKQY